jgi:hypothetical protein
MRRTLQLTLLTLLVYAAYCAFSGEWAKGAFFLVLYHIAYIRRDWVSRASRSRPTEVGYVSRTSFWQPLEMP